MKKIDLHLHTMSSDGCETSIELVNKMAQNGFSAIAITDHDTISGVQAALTQAKKLGIELISGVEFSVRFVGVIHVIGLFINIESKPLNFKLHSLSKVRMLLITKGFRIINSYGLAIMPTEVLKIKKQLTIKNLLEYLLEYGFVKKQDSLYEALIRLEEEWRHSLPDPVDCISLIHECGGIAILAHPLHLGYGYSTLKEVLIQLKDMKLDGMEIMRPDHTFAEQLKLMKLADELGLLYSGGSDYHGNKTGDLTVRENFSVPYFYLQAMKFRREE